MTSPSRANNIPALRDKSNLAQKSGGFWEEIVQSAKDKDKDSTALVDEVGEPIT